MIKIYFYIKKMNFVYYYSNTFKLSIQMALTVDICYIIINYVDYDIFDVPSLENFVHLYYDSESLYIYARLLPYTPPYYSAVFEHCNLGITLYTKRWRRRTWYILMGLKF